MSPCYRVSDKAVFISKGSYGYREPENVFHLSVQKPHLPVRACKLPQFMEGSIRLRMEICVNSGLPITMVPCLHQRNVHIKRRLRVWRAQKCIPLVGAETAPTCTGLQTTPVHGGQYRAENGNLHKFGSTYAMVPCLYQSNVYIKRKLRVWRARKCIPLVGAETAPTCTGLQTTPVHGGKYRAKNGNLHKFRFPCHHATVFPTKQYLSQKEAMGMESLKMYSTCQCRNRTYLYGPVNYPGSWRAVYG